jgi:hypothetical protein
MLAGLERVAGIQSPTINVGNITRRKIAGIISLSASSTGASSVAGCFDVSRASPISPWWNAWPKGSATSRSAFRCETVASSVGLFARPSSGLLAGRLRPDRRRRVA